ncbi:MAG TPA: ABC transporter substrate-binding protein [Spirochaetia bacterium]|nr:ABC transporter substrate-binding protein [Spirochaetia bacterium]
MKKGTYRRILLLALLLIISLLFVDCAKKEAAATKEGEAKAAAAKKQLEIFSWWTAGGEATGLAEMFKIYTSKYPDVEIINATVAGGAGQNAKAVLATRMQGGDPPDSFQVHAGHELIDTWVVAGKMEPITSIFKENNTIDAYPKGVIDIISYKDEIYSVPVNIHRSNVLWYNKEIFAKNKLQPPKTTNEFLAVSKKLAAAGVTPLALGDNGIWASTHLFESVLLSAMGPEKYKGLWNGGTPWDGPDVKKAIQSFIQILGFTNTDHAALSWDAAAQYVVDGKAAMTIMGDWVDGYYTSKGLTPDKEYGWAPSPGTEGAFIMLSDSFGLPKGAPHSEEAINWLKVCASKEGQDAFNPKKGSIPSRTDGDPSLYNAYLQSAMKDFKTNNVVPSVAHGAAAGEGWVTDFNDVMTILVTEKNVDKAVEGFVKAAQKAIK